MPMRGGSLGYGIPGGTQTGSTTVNGYTIPQDLTLTGNRVGAQPAEYVAANNVEFTGEFESASSDEFTAYIADASYAGTGNQSNGGTGVNSAGGYRYGFNGKENDRDVKGDGNQQDYGMRIYDPRLGKFMSVDPLTKKYPWYTPYQFAGNKPIWATDLDGLEEWMKTQEYLLRQKAQLQQQAATAVKNNAINTVAQTLANQPTISQGDNSFAHQQNSDRLKADYQHNKAMYGAVMDPLAANMVYPVANAVGQYSENTINHAYDAYKGFSNGNWWEGTKNTVLFGLDVSPFFIKGVNSASRIDLTLGRVYNNGASLATAAKVGAPFYSEWVNLGIYNPKEWVGWGSAFKYITDKVIMSKGTLHFELSGVDVSQALAGDATHFVGRYTEWELQQITNNATLFKNTKFYLNGVKQSAKELKKLGITAPKTSK